ncbi:mycofactocin-coupled SDR family oxidoreductase [Amycolatopsis japonica]
MGLLDGTVVLVTGGARGQGRAHAVTSAREGADVIILDIGESIDSAPYPLASPDDLKETAQAVEAHGRRALAIQADVRSQDEMNAAVARGIAEFGHIDSVIANAGIWSTAQFWELDEQTWADMMDTNLTGVWKTAKAVAHHMIDRQTGSIVVIASVNALEAGAHHAHYTAAKHGLIGLMKTMAVELAPHGVRCNAICPGVINTDMIRNQYQFDRVAGHPGGTAEEWYEGGYRYGALRGRSFLPPSSIADTALYLNSGLAAHVTGVAIPVEAGHLLLPGHNLSPVRN